MSITLYKKGETTPHTFTQSVRDLKDTTKGGGEFTRAEVTAGDWIFYAKKDYRGDVKDVKKVKGDEKHVTITSVNGSMFLVDAGLILFEEFRFRGERKWFHDNQDDLTGTFQGQPVSGISSGIVLSKNRSVVLTTKEGHEFTMQPGGWYEKLNKTDKGTAGENDKWLSLKFI